MYFQAQVLEVDALALAWENNMGRTTSRVMGAMSIEFFTVCTKLAEMTLLYSKELTTAKKSYLQ